MTKNNSDYSPPDKVATNAKKGLELRRKHGKGGTTVGVARARDLKDQRNLSNKTINKMHSYFARHEVDKKAENFDDDKNPSAGYIAWLLWGGDEAKKWVEEIKK